MFTVAEGAAKSMTGLLPLFGGILVAIIGGAWGYKQTKLAKSGTVKTSEAEVVWAQAQEMRTELREQVNKCEQKCAKVEEENTRLRQGLIHAEQKILDVREELSEAKDTIRELREDLRVALREVQHKADSVSGDVHALKQEMAVIQGGMTA